MTLPRRRHGVSERRLASCREHHRCGRIRRGGEEPRRGVRDAAGEGVDRGGGPEGLAGEAVHEVLQGPAGEGVARQALELGAAGFHLGVGQGLLGGVRRAAGDVGVPAGAVVALDTPPFRGAKRVASATGKFRLPRRVKG